MNKNASKPSSSCSSFEVCFKLSILFDWWASEASYNSVTIFCPFMEFGFKMWMFAIFILFWSQNLYFVRENSNIWLFKKFHFSAKIQIFYFLKLRFKRKNSNIVFFKVTFLAQKFKYFTCLKFLFSANIQIRILPNFY